MIMILPHRAVDRRRMALAPLLLGALAGLFPGNGSGQARSSVADQSSSAAPSPEMVVQNAHQAPVVATLWAEQGRVLFSLAEDGSVVVWDVARRTVIDHAQIPLPKETRLKFKPRPFDSRPKEIRLHGFISAADGRTARVSYAAPGDCPMVTSGGGSCHFKLDFASRVVTPLPAAEVELVQAPDGFPVSPDGKWKPNPNHGSGKDGLFDTADENIAFDEADCTSISRCRYGVNLWATDGSRTVRELTGKPRSYFLDADLSAGGERLVLLESILNDTDARVQVLDLRNGTIALALSPGGAYHGVRWIDGENFVVSSQGYPATDDIEAHLATGIAPSIYVDSECARDGTVAACLRVPAHGLARPIGASRRFIGTGSIKGCYRAPGVGPDGIICVGQDGERGLWPQLEEFRPHAAPAKTGSWKALAVPAIAGQNITALAVAPDSRQIAVATVSATSTSRTVRVLLLAQEAGAAARVLMSQTDTRTPSLESEDTGVVEPAIDNLLFTPDGRSLVFGYRGVVQILELSGEAPPRQIASDAHKIAVSAERMFGIDTGTLHDLATGKPIAAPFAVGTLIKGGFIRDRPVLWAASDDGVLHFWDSRNGRALLTFYSLPGSRYFALAPDGRYDTNLGPDTDQVRWLVSDAPWTSLGAQTFMRDFYEPRLYGKLLECTSAGNCDAVLKPVPPLGALNRVLPVVRITAIEPAAVPGNVQISVEVREGVDPAAANGKTRSGIYDPRVFLNNRLLADDAGQRYEDTGTPEQWRTLNRRTATDGVLRYTLTRPIPLRPGTEALVFSAYAFNEDRVKSDTATLGFTRSAAVAPRARPRAFVVTIGIDAYDEPRLKLQFAADDARLLGERLASIAGYDVRRVSLLGSSSDGKSLRVTRRMIDATLGLLAGVRRTESLAELQAMGVDASPLDKSTPDDIVIITFAGHGWADSQGNFYLVPAEGVWPGGAPTPDRSTLVSSAQITRWLRAIDGADIALIIDACHSAASVDAGGFKPGPMGDAGLGQLAYDKGIRILAATQADDVALEDANLRQGLLTYALAGEGLTADGGKADLNADRRITLDEWLRYATQRLPSLSKDVRLGRFATPASGARGFGFVGGAAARPPKVQEPSLFDFTAAPSEVVLRGAVPAAAPR